VLCLDATNRRSYPGTGTTWTDLSGNGSNGTLTNGPTFDIANGGSIVFDGTNDYVSLTGSISTSSATFIAWIIRSGNQGLYDGILFSRSTNVTGMNLYSNNQLGYHWNNTAYTWGSGLIIPDLEWCMCAVSVSPLFAVAYLFTSNGVSFSKNNTNHSSTIINNIELARDFCCGGRHFKGNISCACIYNRALSIQEVQQNFNATRGRYGI
jgi:hypothetical protein